LGSSEPPGSAIFIFLMGSRTFFLFNWSVVLPSEPCESLVIGGNRVIGDRPRLSELLSCIILNTSCFLTWSSCFSWNYPATKYCCYFFCESWVAKGKIPIRGLTNLVNEARFQLITEKFPVSSLPFFASPAKTQIDRMVVQQVRCFALSIAAIA